MKKGRKRKGHVLYRSKGKTSVYLGWPTEAANGNSIAKMLCKQMQNLNQGIMDEHLQKQSFLHASGF